MEFLSFCLLILEIVNCLYLPGMAPTEYMEGERIDMTVSKLSSLKTQIPQPFYSLNFCPPQGSFNWWSHGVGLGASLAGESSLPSPFSIKAKENQKCAKLCTREMSTSHIDKFIRMIDDDYQINWFVDGLPSTSFFTGVWNQGFPIGYKTEDKKYHLHNHFTIKLKYNVEDEKSTSLRIVGFEVQPTSLSSGSVDCAKTAPPPANNITEGALGGDSVTSTQLLVRGVSSRVTFSYDVVWEPSDLRWASRWDSYLTMGGQSGSNSSSRIHWLAILNALLVVVFLSGIVAMILLKTLRRDIAKYNELVDEEGGLEEQGWKLVCGDVFRKPAYSRFLACAVGTGMQILMMSTVTLAFAIAGFLSPVHRGSYLQAMLFTYTSLGSISGYITAKFYKVWRGEDWKTTTLISAFLFPGIAFGVFFVLNLIIWGERGSGAVPFTTMLAMLLLWFGISVPLNFVGAYIGYTSPTIQLPVRTHKIPRQVPKQPWYLKTIYVCLIGGLLPFGAAFTEVFFLLSSIWQHEIFYLFGILGIVLIIILVTCAEISITLTYFQLASENYNWWWRSFAVSASSGFYMFLYSLVYFKSKLEITRFSSTLLYFGYMALISLMFSLMTGAVGMITAFKFVRTIYGSIKVD